jgi:hypothetical protein
MSDRALVQGSAVLYLASINSKQNTGIAEVP